MRAILLGVAMVVALASTASAQSQQRPSQGGQKDDQSWLDAGPAPRQAPGYVTESEDEQPLDGGMAGSDDLYGDDVLPGDDGEND